MKTNVDINLSEKKFQQSLKDFLGKREIMDISKIPQGNEISDKNKLCKNPLVSILCLAYNHENYIEQTFQGFEMQKCDFEFEIIIGEDKSTDNTLNLCKTFQQKHPEYVRIISSIENVGAKKNSFRNIFAARGKYIAFCEGDDYWVSEDKLQKQINFLESNPEYNFIHTNAEIRDSNNNFKMLYHNDKEIKALGKSENPQSDRLLLKWPVATATTVIKREHCLTLYKSNPDNIFTELRLLGDIQLWSGLMALGKMAYFSETTACYHLSNESATRSKNKKKTFMLFCDAFELYLKLNTIYNNEDPYVYHDIMRRTAQQSLYRAYEINQLNIVRLANQLLRQYGEKNLIITTSRICYNIYAPFWFFHGILRFYSLCNIFYKKVSKYKTK